MAASTNTGKYIDHIVRTTNCDTHRATSEIPCYAVERGEGDSFVVGVCGTRIRSAGFIGEITDVSLKKGPKVAR